MKSYAEPVKPAKSFVPVHTQFPPNPEQGQMFFYDCFGQIGASGLNIYVNGKWIELFSSDNNVWERFIARPKQQQFDLTTVYRTDGKSIVVYINGVRLQPKQYAEVAANMVILKFDPTSPEALKGGELVEFQMFNVRKNTAFDVKEWNRRNDRECSIDEEPSI